MQVACLKADGNGESIIKSYPNLTSSSNVTISSPAVVTIVDDNGKVKSYSHFERWTCTGTASLNLNANPTQVTGFSSNVKVSAVYKNMAPIPTPPPSPYYTLIVKIMGSDGKYYTSVVYVKLAAESVQSISAPSSVTVGDPQYSTQTLYFHSWSIAGTGTLSSANSNSTTVKNFGSNVTVTASYRN